MANMCQQLPIVLLVIFALVQIGTGLKCYSCEELALKSGRIVENNNCGEPFTGNVDILECEEGQVCLKQKTPPIAEISPKMMRRCGVPNVCHTEVMRTLKVECSECTSDLCNA